MQEFKHANTGRTNCWSIMLAVCLIMLPSIPQALTLGDLTTSSITASKFNASMPFSDDKTVRLDQLQARIATESEYRQWGIPSSKVLEQLQLRVTPVSATVGYVEFMAPSALSQNEFDLLVWTRYGQHSALKLFKVKLNNVPSLIKGTVLSMSEVRTSSPIASGKWIQKREEKSQGSTSNNIDAARIATETTNVSRKTLPPQFSSSALKLSEAIEPTRINNSTPPSTEEPPQLHQIEPTWIEKNMPHLSWAGASGLLVFAIGLVIGRLSHRKNKHSLQGNETAASSAHKKDPSQAVMSASISTSIHNTSSPRGSATLSTFDNLYPNNRLTKNHSEKTRGQTNIDLAKIYLSMGDPSTAQMLLSEVIAQGDEDEKKIANQLLKSIA